MSAGESGVCAGPLLEANLGEYQWPAAENDLLPVFQPGPVAYPAIGLAQTTGFLWVLPQQILDVTAVRLIAVEVTPSLGGYPKLCRQPSSAEECDER